MTENKILCVGMCVLDIIHLVAEYPEEDSDKRCLEGYWQRGGNASNSCTVLSKLGACCEFLGMTSSAPAFQFLYNDCVQRKIDMSHCPTNEMSPPFSSVILVKSTGTRTIIHSNPGFPILTYDHFSEMCLENYSWIHFEGRNIEETEKMINKILCHNKKKDNRVIKISVEIEKLNEDLLILAKNADVVFIGKDFAQHLGFECAKETCCSVAKMICQLKTKEKETKSRCNIKEKEVTTSFPMLICTWGAEKSAALDNTKQEFFSIKPPAVKNVVDSLGAGDTFNAGVLFAMNSLNKSLPDAVDYANHLAGYKIKFKGYDCVENFKI